MTSPIGKDKSPEFGSSSLSGVFSVEWIKKYGHVILPLMTLPCAFHPCLLELIVKPLLKRG